MPRRSRFRWNASAGRYIDASGRFVTQQAIRAELDAALAGRQRRMLAVAEQLRTNAISLETWTTETRQLIKDVHLYSAAAAAGGWAHMSPADFGRVGQLVREQYRFLNGFVHSIQGGLVLDGRFLRRVALYAQAGRATYQTILALDADLRGMTEERNVLHPADHCGDCIAMASLGWSPIGSLIPIGDRQCLTGCRCTMEYR